MGFHLIDLPLRDLFDNGAAQYLIDAYTNSIIREMEDDTIERLSPHQARFIKDRLKGLYAFLKNHPALMDRRLKVGSKKPKIPPKIFSSPIEKRAFQPVTAQPVCPSRTSWRLLRYARDINDTEVEVYQPSEGNDGYQWFYTVSCDEEHEIMENPECPACCRGINRNRYASRCITKKSFVMALVRPIHQHSFDWNWIQLESSCNCAISPL
ncbi:neurotrophin-3 isoform X2 [Patella vulgata]|nr:neurotrophin-3 isoform X2 [Patella vulgata]XP_055955031.1 neurotrophin-3 isoform X2 [Patella vulgata]